MQVTKFTEVRTTKGFTVEALGGIAFIGFGYDRAEYAPLFGINAGHPAYLDRFGHDHDGVLPGQVKVTPLTSAPGWVSFRSVGRIGRKRTVYLRDTATLTVEGRQVTVADFVSENR